MASFYSSEGDYSLNQKLGSYRSSELDINNKLYASHELVGPESFRSRDEMMFTRPTSSVDQINRQLSFAPRYSDGNTIIADANSSEQILQYHGLSLSLGSQEQQPLAHLHSGLNQYTNSSLCSLLNSNNDLKNGQYLSFDSAGKDQNTVKYGTFQNNVRSDFTGTLCSSKYLKAAQDLLDELVSVHRVSKISEKVRNFDSVCQDGVSGETQEPVNNASIELSLSERNDLHNKLMKLVSMLDEVDRRYKQYWHQMQALISSLDSVAGPGTALPYTTLALRTISRQFRSLRDAIKKQIHSAQKSLGEQDDNTHGGGVLSRLRYVDQQLRQQKAIQQFGVVRQSWRPQRGLPETAVSVLRAWLFEHFLHPYPKDSEKIVLARETGLTRSQVANWFINARVRLWKPMIEEMYKEEFGDAETELKSSPEHATTTQETSVFNDRGEEFQRSLISPMVDEYQRVHSNELRPDLISNAATDIDACRGLNYANDVIQSNEVNFGLIHMQHKNIVNVSGDSNFCDNNKSADGTMGNQVTLALGLERSEKDSKSMADGIQLRENEYYYVDPVNNQNRFANSHLLSDFVA